MPDVMWFDKPRGYALSHIVGAVAAGLIAGLLLAADRGPGPISDAEVRYLSVLPQPSVAFADRLKFGPFLCEQDCAGHQAGWDWRRQHDTRTVDDCSGQGSTSFLEGCMFYLQVRGYERDEP